MNAVLRRIRSIPRHTLSNRACTLARNRDAWFNVVELTQVWQRVPNLQARRVVVGSTRPHTTCAARRQAALNRKGRASEAHTLAPGLIEFRLASSDT
jgi:hypothetical protein